jgi:hypothetical protein
MNSLVLDSIKTYILNSKFYFMLTSWSNTYLTAREHYLEMILNKNNIVSKFVKCYFYFIILFHYYCQVIGKKIGIQWLCVLSLIISLIISSINLAWLGWIFIFLILRLEFSFTILHRFYRRRMSLFPQHFPDSQDPKRRMHRAAKVIAEAIQHNPVVTSIITSAAGFTAWKYMDLENAKAENERAYKDREAEDRRHRESLQADANQRQLDREAEYRRHSESLEASKQNNKNVTSDNDVSISLESTDVVD